MISPILFTIQIGSLKFSVYWYGIIVMCAILIATWLTSRELKRREGNPDWIWDAIPWILISGIIGARLWFVINYTISGGSRYLENPVSILYTTEGGLHIFGGFLFGGIAFILYSRKNHLDLWLILDSLAPYLLIGQALARPANFINQELYGPPTNLPWGIMIDAQHRILMWRDLVMFPETTRFHPTFAYEMIWNFLAAGLLIFIRDRLGNKLQPGTFTEI